MFEFVDEVLNGVDSLKLRLGFMLNNRIENGHSFVGDFFLDLLLRVTVDQACFQIGENNISNVELLGRVHVLDESETNVESEEKNRRITCWM